MIEDKVIKKEDELAIINKSQLKTLNEAAEKAQQWVSENPFLEPTETTIEEAERRRKTLKNGRTKLANVAKQVKDLINTAKKAIITKENSAVEIIKEAEEKQAAANNKYFDRAAFEKAKSENTAEAYTKYLNGKGTRGFEKEANEALQILKAEAEKARAIFEKFFNGAKAEIEKAETPKELDAMSESLEELNLSQFGDYEDEAYQKRDGLFGKIDTAKERLERELRAREEKAKAEAEAERLRKEKKELIAKAEAEKEKRRKEETERKAKAEAELDEQAKQSASMAVGAIQAIGQGVDTAPIERLYEIRKTYMGYDHSIYRKFSSMVESAVNELLGKVNSKIEAHEVEQQRILKEKEDLLLDEIKRSVKACVNETELKAAETKAEERIKAEPESVSDEHAVKNLVASWIEEQQKIIQHNEKLAREMALSKQGKVEIGGEIFELETLKKCADYQRTTLEAFLKGLTRKSTHNHIKTMNEGKAKGMEFLGDKTTVEKEADEAKANLENRFGEIRCTGSLLLLIHNHYNNADTSVSDADVLQGVLADLQLVVAMLKPLEDA